MLTGIKTAVIYVHGKGGTAAEAEHYKALFPDCDVYGAEYKASTPWEVKLELSALFEKLYSKYGRMILIANSIGAFFAMCTESDHMFLKAYFISPIVDMEQLIQDMMRWARVSKEELRNKKEIETSFGETLSWKYLCYVRENPIRWNVPTEILYGMKDHLSSLETEQSFATRTGANLTIMENGEHWFHTDEEMDFLDQWIEKKES